MIVQHESQRFKSIVVMMTVCTMVYVYILVTQSSGEDINNTNIKKRYWFQQAPQDCSAVCARRPTLWKDVDISTREGLANSLDAAHDTLLSSIKERYGDYYSDIFEVKESKGKKSKDSTNENKPPPAPVGKTRARQAFHSTTESGADNPSISRLRNRFMQKILEVQIALMKQEGSGSNPCDCSKETKSLSQARTRRALNGEDQVSTKTSSFAPMPNYEGNGNADSADPAYSKLVWALGGHSSAAGHGNLHIQSYTAELERLGRQVFGPLGIHFEGRNFAMGGTQSGPEVGMCFKEIFGNDVDIIGWDYALTDGRLIYKSGLYGNRASMMPSFPILMMVGGATFQSVVKKLEEDGMGALLFDDAHFQSMMAGTPEMNGMTQDEIDQVPEAIRYMKCDGKIEAGIPCEEKKFMIDGVCPKRRYMVSWHPGWKYHLLKGHVVALFLIETMLEAVRELDLLMKGGEYPEIILKSLKRKDEMDRDHFEHSSPAVYDDWIAPDDKLDINMTLFYRKPNYCHTGMVPSMTRYKGIVTETPDMVGDTDDTFYTALGPLETGEATDIDKPRKWQLVGTPRQECNETLQKDFKDSFHVYGTDGYMSLTVPNTAELEEYGVHNTLGVIVICEPFCDFYQCPPENIQLKNDPFNSNIITMTIDGQPVTKLAAMDNCFILQGPQGSHWGPGIANEHNHGQYEIKIRVNKPTKFVRVQSIIIY